MDEARTGPSWVGLVLSCVGTAIVVFTLENSLLSGRVSVEDEKQFRTTVERRLSFLENTDLRALAVIEKHREDDAHVFADLEKRLRETEIDSARLIARIVALEDKRKAGGAALRERIEKLDPLTRTRDERMVVK